MKIRFFFRAILLSPFSLLTRAVNPVFTVAYEASDEAASYIVRGTDQIQFSLFHFCDCEADDSDIVNMEAKFDDAWNAISEIPAADTPIPTFDIVIVVSSFWSEG
ncbi:unnamed protein product [Protopolystoma xenopodis]|uniref:Uncharacterized protein n=1 Tax=Protopolystoma xenopodis TaxID=117903 RepID=A0A3S5CC80_9PLAT|nr:unnamed protein product [Protopolystoma xenopodis]